MNFRDEFDRADLRVAVFSDMHIYDTLADKEAKPSYARVGDRDDVLGLNPIADLKVLIRTERLRSEITACLGDIADKARPAALRYGWTKVNELATDLGSASLLATSGNHDCDSRYQYTDYDAKGVLQSLVPTYPSRDEGVADQYWSRNFFSVSHPHCRFVVLNSSAYHGMGSEEIDRGRISAATLERLRLALENGPEPSANILLCHHHPHPHSELNLGDNDLMKGGQQLIELLGSGKYGRWMIIHGHKHHPKLTYAQGIGSAPVIFAAGSLSACLYPELGTRVRNQFHILAFSSAELNAHGFSGRIYSWEWTAADGWTSAPQSGSGLPSVAGFGHRCDPVQLAARIETEVHRKRRMSWDQIRRRVPEVDFILPREFEVLRRKLTSTWSLEIIDRNDLPFEIGKM